MAGEWVFIVQAAWSPLWDFPPFDTLQTRLEMARQVLEVIFEFFSSDSLPDPFSMKLSVKGLAFMHENGIGHGVCILYLSLNICC
jgi:hypothetical protein